MNYLLDTNSIIYMLKGNCKQLSFSENDNIFVSFITKIELLPYKLDFAEELKIKEILDCSNMCFMDDNLLNKTIFVRQNYGLKLADAIIVATAIENNAVVITADKEIIKKSNTMNIKILSPLI